MHRFSHLGETKLYLFNDYNYEYIENVYTGCIRLLNRFSPAEIYVQEELIYYLDLALPSSKHTNLRKCARSLVHSSLPYSCVDFLIAEAVPQSQKFHSLLFDRIDEYFRKHLETFHGELERFSRTLLLKFEERIFNDISNKNTDQKKLIVQRYLKVYELLRFERFSDMFPKLLDLCTNPPLDCELTIDLLMTFCDTDYQKLSVFELAPNVWSLENLIFHAKVMQFDFWGLWSGDGDLALEFDYISCFNTHSLNQEYSEVLLKYGFPYFAGPQSYGVRLFYLKRIKFEDRRIIQSISVFVPHASPAQRTRMMLIIDIFIIFGGFRRTMDVNIIKYLFRSLPLPYVTPTELYNTMLEAVDPDFEPQLKLIVSRYAHCDLFEDDINIYMPRRLVHLCRVAFRKVLAAEFMLLDDILDLEIPESLKVYLVLDS